MVKNKLVQVGSILLLLLGQSVYAGIGKLFHVNTSGTAGNVSISLCLNGKGPLSCQNYNITALNLNISPTTPNRVYPSIGIKVNTPGYNIAKLGIECIPIANGYCLFKASPSMPKNLVVESSTVPTASTVGGTITGLIGTVTLLNNGINGTSISTDGAFTFSSLIPQGSSYTVTVQTQPANQTCTVNNPSGTMINTPVTNVVITCSTNAYTVGGTITGLSSGTLTLLNINGDAISQTTNGAFTFPTPIAQGSTYAVTVQLPYPTNQTCSVSGGSNTMGGGPVTDITVTCSTTAYTVGGTLTGLMSDSTLTLLNNGGDAISETSSGPFTFPTAIPQGSTYNVTVQLPQPDGQTCSVDSTGTGTMGSANITNVNVSCAAKTTTITVSPNGIIPYTGSSLSQNLTVTNTGSSTANNVLAILPGGWANGGVTQNASNCISVAPGDMCTLSFTSTTPYVAQGNITVTGDNITSPPTTALAFSVGGYLVWSVNSPTSVSVIDTNDISSEQWGDESVITYAQNYTDGNSNTSTIYNTPNVSPSAAVDCYNSSAGDATAGTWYLPAICQMFTNPVTAPCPSNLPSIDNNLVQLGFGGLDGSTHWSSTEYEYYDGTLAWIAGFSTSGSTNQDTYDKEDVFGVRCAREITL